MICSSSSISLKLSSSVDSDDSDSDDESEVEEESLSDIEEEEQIIERISHLFDDDEPEIIVPAWKLKLQSITNKIHNTYTSFKHKLTTIIMYMYPVYLYLTTTSHNQMIEDLTTLTHNVDSYIHSKFTNIITATMKYIHKSMTYIRSIPSKLITFYNTFVVKEVVVLEISEFQEFQFQKIVEESSYDLESEEMDLFDGGLFGADTDSESEEENETVRRIENLFEDTPEPEMEIVYKKVTTIENAFCFGCGAHWEEGHVCDSTFKQD